MASLVRVVVGFCPVAILLFQIASQTRIAAAMASPSGRAMVDAPRLHATPAAGSDPLWIAYQWGGRIRVMRPDGSDDHVVTTDWTGGEQFHPDWSPTGNQLAFSVDDTDGTRDIWIVDSDGSRATLLFDCRSPCAWTDDPAWSPDGLSIAFDLTNSDNGANASSIRVIALEDQSISTIFEAGEPTDVIWAPRWAPDGQQIVFEIDRYAEPSVASETVVGSAIGVVSLVAEANPVHWLTSWDSFAQYPDWNPRDDRIVFSMVPPGRDGGAYDLFTILPDGSQLTRVTEFAGTGYQAIHPIWRSDGTRIMFVKDQMGINPTLAEIQSDGRAPSTIQEYPFQVTHPRPSPASGP